MKRRIPPMDIFINENKDYAAYCVKKNLLKEFGISDNDINHIMEIYNRIAKEMGDSGSCVLGNGIKINGKNVINSYAQGSLGLEKIQKEIIPYLRKKYPNLQITYEWGNMD